MRSSPVLLVALGGLLVAACTADEPSPSGGGDLEIAGEPAAWFETDRLRFAYPESLDVVEQEPGDTQSVRIEAPSDRGDYAEAFVYATWPLLQGASLDETITLFQPDRASGAIQEFDESQTEVPGASEAVEQRFVAADAVPGEVVPITCRAVYAMADIGRTMHLIACVDQAGDYDADALVDGVVDSLELLGGESHGDAGDTGDRSAGPIGTALLGGALHVDVPDDWDRVDVQALDVFQPADADFPALTAEAIVHDPDADLDDIAEDLFEAGRLDLESATVDGAIDARRVRYETDGGLWQHGILAQNGAGEVFLVLVTADAAGPPDHAEVDALLDSVALTPRGDDA